ncbi:hypothetical protein THAOC_05541 [Thalassiosira oceanica]|uniref:Uncharacterized protein n=1 Tax=Thalassiosira oceanica TaxID=159749 RepID=K0TMQ2_THAOC|nr:hypothetical protein THAOC_05541 [Thalassiosira oceanica]|eukprot:EJK72882.1 hypothetical protein THAOC_05541 [Thalassiosira oceanica]
MEGQGKTAKTYARRAQEICAVRAVVEATTATTRDREAVASRQSPSSVVFADRSAHRFPESDCLRSIRSSTGEPAGSRLTSWVEETHNWERIAERETERIAGEGGDEAVSARLLSCPLTTRDGIKRYIFLTPFVEDNIA